MTDKEALKVLESWLRLAYHNADGTDEDSAELYEALQTMFALINRLQEENSNLKIELQAMRNAANSYKAETERLKDRNVELWGENRVAYKKAKVETVKEFANLLREFKAYVGNSQGAYITDEDINNFVKEMEGEK